MAKDLPFRIKFKAVDKLSGAIDRVANKFPKLSRNITKTNNRFKILQTRTAMVRKNLKGLGSRITNVGKTMTVGLTAPIVAFGALAVRATVKYQKSMNKVQALTGASAEEMKKMQKQARLLGKTTAFSASQAGDAMAFFGQAGFNANEIMKATPATLDLAAASSTDLARSADILSNVMGGFNIEAGKAGMVSDVLSKATAKGNINMEMIAESMKDAAPVAEKYGATLQETAALTAKLGDAGIQGSKAGTTLKNMFTRIAAPTNRISAIMKKLGVQTKDESGNLRSMTDILVDMNKQFAAKGLTKANKLAILNEVFGKRAIAGAGVLVNAVGKFDKASGKTINTVAVLTEELEKSNGAAKKMAETMLKGLPGAITKLKSAFEGLLLKIGIEGGLAGMAEVLINKLTGLINWVSSLNPTLLKWGMIIAGIVAVIGPLIAGLGLIVGFIPSIITGFNMIVAGFAIFAKVGAVIVPVLKVIGVGLGLLLSPIGAVVAAVAGLINLFLRWDKIKTGFKKGFFTGVKTFFGFGGDDTDKAGAPAGGTDVVKKEKESAEKKSRDMNAKVGIDIGNLPQGSKTKLEGDTDFIDLTVGMAGAAL